MNGRFSLFEASSSPSRELPWSMLVAWVVRLRFTIFFSEALIALGVRYVLHIPLPLGWIFLIVGLTGISNFALRWGIQRPRSEWEFHPSTLVGLLFFCDILALTVLLMFTGGSTNPFTVLYLIYMTLSAATLRPAQTWFLGAFSTLCFGTLFFLYRPIPELEMSHHGSGTKLHLIGMWIGFLITVFLVATFAGAISKLLRSWNGSLMEMQQALAKKDRLASLATLAAGAAHELNTPLGTIVLLAKELEHQLDESPYGDQFKEDCRVIRYEVERCQQILGKLSGPNPASETNAEQHVSLGALLVEVKEFAEGLGHPVAIEVSRVANLSSTHLARGPVWQSLSALLKNAADASPDKALIHLSVGLHEQQLQFRVQDQGSGMSEETLRRIGEPFFTTKEPGKGMGLGAFLAGTVAEQQGGRLFYQSIPQKGTLAVFEIPFPNSRR